jgi:hypothetical protein
MERYKNHAGDSGVVAYETGPDFIRVQFIGGETYLYTYESTGADAVELMKTLAEQGRGLSTFISQSVKGTYATKGT